MTRVRERKMEEIRVVTLCKFVCEREGKRK